MILQKVSAGVITASYSYDLDLLQGDLKQAVFRFFLGKTNADIERYGILAWSPGGNRLFLELTAHGLNISQAPRNFGYVGVDSCRSIE